MYAYAVNNPLHYIDPDGNYIILNEYQKAKTKKFVTSENAKFSPYFGAGNERYISMGYYFSNSHIDNPQVASSYNNKSPSLSMSSSFGSIKITSNSEVSMNGNLETGFNFVDKYKKTSELTPKVCAYISEIKDGKATINVRIEIGNNIYSGTVAYAGLSEVQTNGKDDKAKIDKIANESINFLRGTSNETKNLTE